MSLAFDCGEVCVFVSPLCRFDEVSDVQMYPDGEYLAMFKNKKTSLPHPSTMKTPWMCILVAVWMWLVCGCGVC